MYVIKWVKSQVKILCCPIARSRVTVTRLLCDPLPYKNVLKVPHAGKSGRKYRFSFQYKMYRAFSQIFPACGTPDRAVDVLAGRAVKF
jgi:hypothetical protein